MFDLFILSFIFCLVVFLLKKKINVGITLIIASLCLMAFYLFSIEKILNTFKMTILEQNTLKLLLALSLIRCVELVLRENNLLTRIMDDVKSLVRHKKFIIISMPIVIGLLPSLGGAYFSAPMVDETTKDTTMPPEEKAFINYWFRHIWEPILPLYPGILLASALSSIDLRTFVIYNSLVSIVMLICGFVFSMRGLTDNKIIKNSESLKVQILQLLKSFTPITIILIMVIVFNIELHYALTLVFVILLIRYKYDVKRIYEALKYGFCKEVFVLILGIMLFKVTLDNSGAVSSISQFFNQQGLPLLPVLIIIPFIIGLLTGLTIAFVGGAFPLLISIAGGSNLNQLILAFVSGYAGVLLSPVHLCLILTREYFKADVSEFYKRLFYTTGITMLPAIVYFYII
ncbi:MAG: DUF401 family protein [Thermodesulfovibrionales bacterium]|nr:DUF401 family protein [Thermodesulfovibrionales bacterium]